MAPPTPADNVGRWFLAQLPPPPAGELPEPEEVAPYREFEGAPPKPIPLPPPPAVPPPVWRETADWLSQVGGGYALVAAASRRFQPNGYFGNYARFRNAGFIGLGSFGWQAGHAGYELFFEEGGEDPVFNYLLVGGMGLAVMNVSVGMARERIVHRVLQGGLAFPDAATVAQLRYLTGTQIGLGAVNLGFDALTATHLRERWREEPDWQNGIALGIQAGSVVLFGVGRHDLERAKVWFKRRQSWDVEAVGETVARRILASGIRVNGVTAQDVASDPYYLVALFLDLEGLPEHLTYGAAERSHGQVIGGDLSRMQVARQIIEKTGPDGRPLLGVVQDPRSFPYADMMPAVLRHMGREVRQKDLEKAVQRGESGRWLRWLIDEYYDQAVLAGLRVGEEVEFMPGPSRSNPGHPMEIDEIMTELMSALQGQGWVATRLPANPIRMGKGSKVYLNAIVSFRVGGHQCRIIYSQASGNPILYAFVDNGFIKITPRELGPVDDAPITVFKRFKVNLKQARAVLARRLGVSSEEVKKAIKEGTTDYNGFLKDLSGNLHNWSFRPTEGAAGRVHWDSLRYAEGEDPEYFLGVVRKEAGEEPGDGSFADIEQAYVQLRAGLERLVDPRPFVNNASHTRLALARDGFSPNPPVELEFGRDWIGGIELLYHGMRAGGLYDELMTTTYRVLEETGAYGCHRGDCMAHQNHLSFPPSIDPADPSKPFEPVVRVARAYSRYRADLVEAFPPAPQRSMYISPPRKREASALPKTQVAEAWAEVEGPFWSRYPNEGDDDYFVRIGERIAVLWDRHTGEINLDNIVTARARVAGDPNPQLKLVSRSNPPPTVEFRTRDTPEKLVVGADGNPDLVVDPEGLAFQRRVWAAFFQAVSSGKTLERSHPSRVGISRK